ncbi:MAG TPA: LysM peptidoglycan-binding domain-containing protein [Ilumatobacteraceae bacterium]|nr:LysM peptidoglycan-binding domain-containing protein [Ilumatobacteraceae bacterium]
MSAATQRTRIVLAWIGLVILVVGVPVLLSRIAGWPLPTSVPSWSRVSTAVQQGDIPADVVIKVIAVCVWLIWAQFVWAIAWEFVVNVPRSSRGRRPVKPPLVASGVGSLAGRFVAVLLSVGLTVAIPSPVVALSAPSATVNTIAHHSTPVFMERATRPTPTAPASWRVADGDSVWAIAEHALGDGSRSAEILELNPALRSARDLRVGQTLALPVDAIIPADRQSPEVIVEEVIDSGSTPVLALPEDLYMPSTVITIEAGDTLWDLSDQRLADAGDANVTGSEIVGYLNDVIASNPDVIEDPSLIFPGEQFAFPQIGEAPQITIVPPVVDTAPDVELEPAAPLPTVAAEGPIVTAATVDPVERPDQSSETETSTAPTSAAEERSVLPPLAVDVGDETSTAPWLAGITSSTVLAAGALALLRRRRAVAAVRGARHLRPATAAASRTTERQLVAAADVPLVRWVNHELACLVDGLDASKTDGGPVAVEFSEERGIELLWDAPNLSAPRPWEATEGGWSWRLLYDPDVELPARADPRVLPGLVTIGRRVGNQVLVDLEAFGSLAIVGDVESVDECARSMILELATGEELANAYLHLVDVDLWESDATLPRTIERTEQDLVEHLRGIADDTRALLDANGLTSTFRLRVGDDADGRELTVGVVRADRCADIAELVALAQPRSGVALLVLGPATRSGATLQLEPDGNARLEPLGLTVEAARLPVATGLALDALLQPADATSETEPDAEDEGSGDAFDSDIEPPVSEQLLLRIDALDGTSDDDWTRPDPDLLVRVLGTPTIDEHPGLGRAELNIVVFLACAGGKATEDQVIDAVWNGRLVERSTLWNKMSRARSVLGRLLPPREQSTGVVRLHPAVMTDLHLFAALVDRARVVSSYEAIELLTDALGLVRGVPFDAVGYEWAYEQQHHARACALIETAGLRVVDLALEADDVNSARAGVNCALAALKINEPLYRARMKVEAHMGNTSGVQAAYNEIVTLVGDLEGASESRVSLQTARLYEALTSQ